MKYTKDKIKIEQFQDIETKEVAYLLGYFWADGYIRRYITGSNNIVNSKVSLEINAEDAICILPIMELIGTWSIYKRPSRNGWKETWTYSSNHVELYDFLNEHGYLDKSRDEPTLILSKINRSLLPYFWKGYVDGDGSIGFCGRGSYFEIASTYNYQYSEAINWLSSLGITTMKIYRAISRRGHQSSVMKVYGKPICKITNYLPQYGLERKNQKLLNVKSKYE